MLWLGTGRSVSFSKSDRALCWFYSLFISRFCLCMDSVLLINVSFICSFQKILWPSTFQFIDLCASNTLLEWWKIVRFYTEYCFIMRVTYSHFNLWPLTPIIASNVRASKQPLSKWSDLSGLHCMMILWPLTFAASILCGQQLLESWKLSEIIVIKVRYCVL